MVESVLTILNWIKRRRKKLTYNFDKVQDESFCCLESFLDSVMYEYDRLQNSNSFDISVTVVAKGELAQEVFRRLFSYTDDCGDYVFQCGFIEMDRIEYDDEYFIVLSYDNTIFVEKMVTDSGAYLLTESEMIFIHGDCNYRALERLDDGVNNIVIFDFYGQDCRDL